MVKGATVLLSLGLVILSILGWASPVGVGWLSLICLLGGLWGFMVAASSVGETERVGAPGPIVVGLGLLITWLVALSSNTVVGWQLWWTFSMGCAFILVGLASFVASRVGRPLPH